MGYYYTCGDVRARKHGNGKFCLVVNYIRNPAQKTKTTQKRGVARSVDGEFRFDPPVFDSAEEAMMLAKPFRNHVEAIVRGVNRTLTFWQRTDNMRRYQIRQSFLVFAAKKKKKEREEKKQTVLEEKQRKVREEWQAWRTASIIKLDEHILAVPNSTVHQLLQDPTENKKDLSDHVCDHTMRKAMVVRHFLYEMKQRDSDDTHFVDGGVTAVEVATRVGECHGVCLKTVYNYYREWRDGEAERWKNIEEQVWDENIDDDTANNLFASIYGFGSFVAERRGSYHRPFILDDEDLKIEFKTWMRSQLKKLSVKGAQQYVNSTLLKDVSVTVLQQYGLKLPVSHDTVHNWMKKCGASRMDNKKTYYNDQHQNPQVINYRTELFKRLYILQKRMRVWNLCNKIEQEEYIAARDLSPFKECLPLGEERTLEGVTYWVYHMDHKDGWELNPVLHPDFDGAGTDKPPAVDWYCHIHEYNVCKCHLELREYGQDESIFKSGETAARRWGLDGRSYAQKKGMGTSRMASVFKDYAQHGVGLQMTEDELEKVNQYRKNKYYQTRELDGTVVPMEGLTESPGLKIIDHSKAGEGYWNYQKMARQTEDVIVAMDVLQPNLQQLHQYDWSSGHKAMGSGALMVNSMNGGYGGSGNRELRDSKLTTGDVGEGKAIMYKIESNNNGVNSCKWSLENPEPNDDDSVNITAIDCRVYPGQVQRFTFDTEDKNPPPPFYKLDAPFKTKPKRNKSNEILLNKKTKKPQLIVGYAGEGKGIKQVLWERGLWLEGMTKCKPIDSPDYPELDASVALSLCEDFQKERTAMEKLVHSYGHLIEFMPKGHPETAECGIEYDNGVAKIRFRKTNLQVGQHCERDTKAAYLSITLQTAKNTARKARAYMRAYMDDSGGSHCLIEKYVKQVKCHRNILDMDLRFLKDLDEQEKKESDKKKRVLECLLKEMKTNHTDMKEEKVKIETLNKEVEEDKQKHGKLQQN